MYLDLFSSRIWIASVCIVRIQIARQTCTTFISSLPMKKAMVTEIIYFVQINPLGMEPEFVPRSL